MQKLEIKFGNELDLTLLDNEFFIAMLNQIMLFKKCRCNVDYPKTKVYFHGSHFIGIPLEKQLWKK